MMLISNIFYANITCWSFIVMVVSQVYMIKFCHQIICKSSRIIYICLYTYIP